jgi:hypothetical protein
LLPSEVDSAEGRASNDYEYESQQQVIGNTGPSVEELREISDVETFHKDLQRVVSAEEEEEEEGEVQDDQQIELTFSDLIEELKHDEVRVPPHVVKTRLHPNDLRVEKKIHEAYKNQKFVGQSHDGLDDVRIEAEERSTTPGTTTTTEQQRLQRTRNPQRIPTAVEPEQQQKGPGKKRTFVVKRPKSVRAEALASRESKIKEFEAMRSRSRKQQQEQSQNDRHFTHLANDSNC